VKLPKLAVKAIISIALFGSALYFGYQKYEEYFTNPWTRDGQVRAQVIQVAPRVSGTVVYIAVHDNQFVHKGDLLFVIDPSTYQSKVNQNKADLERAFINQKGDKVELDRVQEIAAIDEGAVSKKELIRREINYLDAGANIDSSKEKLELARLDLSFTKIYASVDGYVSNINFQIGSQAVANQPILALVDANSFWIFGYFREDQLSQITIGNPADVTLMAYPDTILHGNVESIGWGIAPSDGNAGAYLLPSVKPVFQWIRLAQRIPVRIKLDEKSTKDIHLRFGLSASVMVLSDNNNTKGK
jgi:RND family efflux transporter MFP subunit